jgi:hypothetical protein
MTDMNHIVVRNTLSMLLMDMIYLLVMGNLHMLAVDSFSILVMAAHHATYYTSRDSLPFSLAYVRRSALPKIASFEMSVQTIFSL